MATFKGFATDAIHSGQDSSKWIDRAVIPHISLSTTFLQTGPGEHAGYEYSRSGNPTRTVLETCLASLEKTKHALVFASGLAATDNVSHLLKSGDHLICSDDVYGGTNRYFSKIFTKDSGVELTMIDMLDLTALEAAFKPNTKMVWIESPSNPMMKIIDIEAVARMAHAHPNCFVVVDNTFATPYFQRPVLLGADIILHSMTKYMNGHGDVVMGCVCTSDEALYERLLFFQNAIGGVSSPFDCYMANRGLKTLHLRMERHFENGLRVAMFLEQDTRVTKVLFPFLPSHPQHEVAKRQMRGTSGMVTFYIKGGEKEARAFLSALKLFTLAESLGGFESLAEHPAIMTHASVPANQRETLGISDSLIRLSVGLEDVEDLVADLDQALRVACDV